MRLGTVSINPNFEMYGTVVGDRKYGDNDELYPGNVWVYELLLKANWIVSSQGNMRRFWNHCIVVGPIMVNVNLCHLLWLRIGHKHLIHIFEWEIMSITNEVPFHKLQTDLDWGLYSGDSIVSMELETGAPGNMDTNWRQVALGIQKRQKRTAIIPEFTMINIFNGDRNLNSVFVCDYWL